MKEGDAMKEQRNTRQQRLVLDSVLSHVDHPTADEVYADVQKEDDRVSKGTIYRNLNKLAENGEIRQIKSPGSDKTRFDWRTDPHYHLICKICGDVVDAPIPYMEDLDEKIAQLTGNIECKHKMFFECVCNNCQNE